MYNLRGHALGCAPKLVDALAAALAMARATAVVTVPATAFTLLATVQRPPSKVQFESLKTACPPADHLRALFRITGAITGPAMTPLQEADILELISAGESETVEFKASIPRPEVIANNIAAFANAAGGTLLIGIEEPANVVGVDPKKALDAIRVAFDKVSPRVTAGSGETTVNGKHVVFVRVSKSETLTAAAGGFYGKKGDRIVPLTADEIKSRATSHESIERALTQLSGQMLEQTQTIDRLREEQRKANSLPRKIFFHVLSVVIGAIVGAILKHVFDHWGSTHSGAAPVTVSASLAMICSISRKLNSIFIVALEAPLGVVLSHLR